MTENKPIIIDGVDVSGCSCHYNGWSQLYRDNRDMCDKGYDLECKPKENGCWHYTKCLEEQLARKTQECEELKKKLTDFMNGEYCANGCAKMQTQYKEYYCKLIEQFDQLKAKNEKYQLFIEKLCDYAGLECDNEEQAMRTLSDLASQVNKARWIIDRYKQTLTKIKEIAEYEFKELMNADDYHNMTEVLKQILQIIDEVE